MNSMTGFGRATVQAGEQRWIVEVRSVNNKGLDVKVRLGESDPFCENEIARALRQSFERGSIVLNVRKEQPTGGEPLARPKIVAAYQELVEIAWELGVSAPVTMDTVAAYLGQGHGPDVIGPRAEALWEILRPAIEQAIGDLRAARLQEGEALLRDCRGRAKAIEGMVAELRRETRDLPQKAVRRLEERLTQLKGTVGLDPGRLAQEVALLTERLDVTEELVRLETHLGQLTKLIHGQAAPSGGSPATSGGIGRKLDFLLQEIGRELNTLNAKSQDATVAGMVIEAKLELEKIREQAQNIE
jgi:uncharacterized protein (TIGR00255 family)